MPISLNDPRYKLDPGYKRKSLFEEWYDKYVSPIPTPAPSSQYAPPSLTPEGAAIPATPAQGMQKEPGELIKNLALPQVPRTPGIAPVPDTQKAPGVPSATEDTFSNRLSEGLRDPAKYGLLAAGLSMMATPPRKYPYSAGEILGRSGLAGLEAFQQASTAKRRDQLAQAEADYRSARLEIERQKLKETSGDDAIISKERADAMGIPWATGITYGQLSKAHGAIPKAEKEKETTPSYVRVQLGDTEATLDKNRKDVQEWLANNPEAKIISGKDTPEKHKYQKVLFTDKDGKQVEKVMDTETNEFQKAVEEGRVDFIEKGGGDQAYLDWYKAFEEKNKRKPSPEDILAYKRDPKAGEGAKLSEGDKQWNKARESLVKDQKIKNPTNRQIAEEMNKMFKPPPPPKAGERDPRAEMKGKGYSTGKEYLEQATDREDAKERIRAMRDAGWTREQIEKEIRGTKWE